MPCAEDVASMVWNFLKAAGSLVNELDKEDETKLLRLRMKKSELIILPGTAYRTNDHEQPLTDADSKFISVTIHDTPPA